MFFVTTLLIQSASAITADSTDYSTTSFGTGTSASSMDSDGFEGSSSSSSSSSSSGSSLESEGYTASLGLSSTDSDTTTQTSTPAASSSPTESTGSDRKTITLMQTCEYNWDCTPWSFCSDGKQTRECKNIGTCEGAGQKPKEEVSCSELLLDIVLKLKKLELTPDKTLKFSINLKETFGTEKVDVHIKYTLTDSNNNDIFSQIETLAIKGNLFYEKEINEIQLQNGDYTLRVDVLYGNLQRAFAEQDFKVQDGKVEIDYFASIIQTIRAFMTAIKHRFSFITETSFDSAVNSIILTSSYDLEPILIMLVAALLIALLVILRKNVTSVHKKSAEHLSRINKHIKYHSTKVKHHSDNAISSTIGHLLRIMPTRWPSNSIFGLIGKRVYSESGKYIGRVEDVIVVGTRIEKLKIKSDKRNKSKAKGIIIRYKRVKDIGDIVIIG